MKTLLKKILSPKYKRRIKEELGVPSLHWSLENLKRKNFIPSVILDIGAYKGNWTTDVLEVFPDAKILMIEAQEDKESFLKDITQKNKNVEYVMSLVSARDQEEVLFSENKAASHVIKLKETKVPHRLLYSKTVDTLLKEKNFPYPQFLKVDVQSHELEVLKGAEKTLEHAEICLLEVSLMDKGDNRPLLFDVVNFMDSRNFNAYDISQLIKRPFDQALFQIDMFFVKKDSFLLEDKRWR